MKQQSTAIIDEAIIDGKTVQLPVQADIALEFSAIDTGGGFRDPILDFTYQLPLGNGDGGIPGEVIHNITLLIRDPYDGENTLSITYDGVLTQLDENRLEGMGRLQDEKVGRKMITFIMRCLR